MWQWLNTKKWEDFSSIQTKMLTEAKENNTKKLNIDSERYVEFLPIMEISRIMGELPDDIKGVCALQRRRDDPNRVRLVRDASIPTIFTQKMYVHGDKSYFKTEHRLKAQVYGAPIVDDFDEAECVLLDFEEKISDDIKRVVLYCKKNDLKIYERTWIDECIVSYCDYNYNLDLKTMQCQRNSCVDIQTTTPETELVVYICVIVITSLAVIIVTMILGIFILFMHKQNNKMEYFAF